MLIKGFTQAAFACVLLLGAAGTANATAYTYTSSTAFQSSGPIGTVGTVTDQVNWALFDQLLGQPSDGGSIPSGQTEPTPGGDNVMSINGSSGNPFVTYVEGGSNWQGLFNNGTTILTTSGSGTITLNFSVPIVGLGVDLQTVNSGAYNFTLTAYNASNQELTSVSNSGVSNGGYGMGSEGTVPFTGITTDAANDALDLAQTGISYVVISSTNDSNGIAIDTSLLYHYPINTPTTPTQTPEPGTLGLLGAGLAGLGYLRRRRKA